MSKSFDLHCHSTESDGTLTPTQLVERAAAAGVDVLALTDHDTTRGIAEARQAAEGSGLELVAGVEISITWNKMTIHMLGLKVDHEHAGLQQGLRTLREFRGWRAEEMGRRLERKGIAGAYAGARALSNGRLISRTHFARFLVRQGYADSDRQVFKKYLVSGKPGHVAGEWAELEEAVSWVRNAGGKAVIAHPVRYKLTRSKLRKLLSHFVAVGGEGLEVVSGSHSRDECYIMANLAREFGLAASAGSDFHTPENSWTDVGRLLPMPDGVRPVWLDW